LTNLLVAGAVPPRISVVTLMLSAHEKKQLEAIEAALQADDPVWAVWPALLVTGIVLGVTPLVIVAATVLALSPAAAVLLILYQLRRKD
jgi:hypothetical protein